MTDQPSKLFLSYARGDDEPFVKRLYQRLTGENFKVWWDRESMPGRGLTFLKEIREAIRAADRTVVVIGPRCVASDYCRAEWQAALAEAKVVNPILRLGEYTLLPPELRNLDCSDFRNDALFEDKLRKAVRDLREPPPPLGRLSGGVPDVPPHFQPRPDDLSRLAARVLVDETQPTTLAGPQRATVLHGMGGSGKSVLAATFARSTSTRRSFTDGVYWVHAAESSEPGILVSELGRLLGSVELEKTLAERSVLIVIDNAWHVEQIEPIIDVLGPAGRLLVTTRIRELATATGAGEVELDSVGDAAALQHLADWAGVSPESLPAEARQVAAECGNLPFALALNGAMYSQGVGWADLLEALQTAEIDYAEQRFKGYPYPTVLKSIKVSVDALASEDTPSRERLVELAAFHPEAGVPEQSVELLWNHTAGLAPRHARKTLAKLTARSLIRMDGEAPGRRVLIHDLQRDFLLRIAEPDQLNRKILSAYEKASAGDWLRVPADGYIHKHLLQHMLADGRESAIRTLLERPSGSGRNAWFEVNDAADNVTGYLADLDRLRSSAADEEFSLLLLLMRNSVENTLVRIPAQLNAALLRSGRSGAEAALAGARAIADPDKRVSALLALAPQLSASGRDAAMAVCLSVVRSRGNQVRGRFLPKIAGWLSGDERTQVIAEALEAARTISIAAYRAPVLGDLLPLVEPSLRPQIEAEAEAALMESVISPSFPEAASAVLPNLPALAGPLLERARKIGEPFLQALAFEAIVPHLPEHARAAAAREGIRCFDESRANGLWIVVSLARHDPAIDVNALIQRALSQDTRQVAALVEALPGLLEGARLQSALDAVADAAAHFPEGDRIDTRIQLLQHRDPAARQTEVESLLGEVAAVSFGEWQTGAYVRMIEYLEHGQLIDVRKRVARIGDSPAVLRSVAELARYGDDALRHDVFARVQALADSRDKFVALVTLAEQNRSAIKAAYGLRNWISQWQKVSRAAVALARLLENPNERDNVLEAAWQAAFRVPGFSDEREFIELLPMLPEIARVAGFRQLLAGAEQLSRHRQQYWAEGPQVSDNSSALAHMLETAAPHLPDSVTAEALEAVRRMTDSFWRCIALCHLAPVLKDAARYTAIEEIRALSGNGALDFQSSEQRAAACRAFSKVEFLSDRLPGIVERLDVGWVPGVMKSAAAHLSPDQIQSLTQRVLAQGNIHASVFVSPYAEPALRWEILLWAARETDISPEVVEGLLEAPADVCLHACHDLCTPARIERAALADRFAKLAPIAVSIGENSLLAAAARGFLTVEFWWP